MSYPTFLIIGTQKGGTTWLADMLKQHPQVYMPAVKEIHFFNKQYNYQKGLGWYEQFFEGCRHSACGEATPNYLWTSDDPDEIAESRRTPDVPKLIHQAYPDIKLIASLRNPVDRAISAYCNHIRAGRISPKKSIAEVCDHLGIVSMGNYEKHIEKWLEYFDRSQFLFLIFEEDIKANRRQTLQKVFKFLEIDDSFIPNGVDERSHPSLGPLYRNLSYYLPWLKKLVKKYWPNLNRDKLPFKNLSDANLVSPEDRKTISERFEGFNKKLPELIGRKPPW